MKFKVKLARLMFEWKFGIIGIYLEIKIRKKEKIKPTKLIENRLQFNSQFIIFLLLQF